MIVGQGGYLSPNKNCAPVDVFLDASFSSSSSIDLSKIKIAVDWGDGNTDLFDALEHHDQVKNQFIYYIENETYTYPKGGSQCNYEVVARPVINNVPCDRFFKSDVTVWDTDDVNGGILSIEPERFLACPGEEFTITFDDVSRWNCTPPDENDKKNNQTRWTRFTYGTVETETSFPRISGIKIDGLARTFPFQGAVKEHTYSEGDEDLGIPEVEVLEPDHESLAVTVPADAQIGQIFEIKLENWNVCNPYDPADESNAVYTYAYIEIVAPAAPAIEDVGPVCPEESIILKGSEVSTPSLPDNSLEYVWEIFEGNSSAGAVLGQGEGKEYEFGGFDEPGQYLVRLNIKRKGIGNNDVACWNSVEKLIDVYEAPTVDNFINGNQKSALSLCFDADNPSQTVLYEFKLESNNNYEYQLGIFDRNSTAADPETSNPWQTVTGGGIKTEQFEPTYTEPGQYRVKMLVRDLITGCETHSESVTTIYGLPEPNFTSSELCEGQATSFTNTSSLPLAVNGDQITGYLWDFGDGTATSTDKDPSHSYAAAGTYEVKLEVSTQGGCTAELKKEVIVKKVPQALLDYDYTAPICPGKVTFENLSFAANNSAFGDGVVTYTLVRSDGTTEEEFAFDGEEKELLFINTTNANITYQVWLKAVADGCEKLSDPLSVEVLPGAQAGFYEPNYNAANINCSAYDFTFIVDASTLDLGAEKHHWEIYKNDEYLEGFSFGPGEDGYEVLEYTAVNNDEVSARYEIFLIPEKAGLCIQTAVNAYKIYPQPTAEDIAVEVRNECEFSFVHVKVNGTGVWNYHWDIDQLPENATELQYDDEFELIYQRPEPGTGALPVNISLIKENYFGCSSEEMQPAGGTVTIPEQVIEEVSLELANPGDENGCSPLTVGFMNTTTAPAGTTFEFYVKHGINEIQAVEVDGDINGSFSFTFEASGIYAVSMKATAPDGCSLFSETDLRVEVYADPKPYFNIENREGCAPFEVSIRKNIANSIQNRWFITDLNEETTVEENDLSIFSLANDTQEVKSYEIKLLTESPGGCQADSSIVVQVFPAVSASFSMPTEELCQPYEISVSNESENPEGTVYTWNWGDGTTENSSDATLTHTYTNTSFQNSLSRYITLTAETPDGCQVSETKELRLLPQVKVSVVPNKTEGCAPLQVDFRNHSEGITNHLWEVREQGSTGAPLYTATTSLPEIPELLNDSDQTKVYEVLYTGSNAAGCSATSITEINVFPGTGALFSMSETASLCTETAVTFTNENIKPGVYYIWQWNDGEPNDTTTTEATIKHTFINTSTTRVKQYEVILTAKNQQGVCADTHSEIVRVNPAVLIAVSPDKQEGCAPLGVNFSNGSQNVDRHYWYARQAGSTQREQEQTSAQSSFLFSNSTAGVINYEVVYVGTSATGCADSLVQQIKVYPELEPLFSTDSAQVRLPNSTFRIFNETPHADAWEYHWDFGDGTTSTATDPGAHTYDTYGKYTITLTVSNGVCIATYQQEVKVNEILPIVDFESIPVSGCWPLEVYFQNKSKFADENTYYWDFGDGEGFSRALNPTYTYFKPGEYTVTLSASNPSGEVVSTSYAIVTVYERPRANFEVRDKIVYVPGDPVYIANHTRGAVSYTWDFGDGTTYHEFEPQHYYQEPGIYTITLIAQNEWGCADTLVREELITAEAGGKAKVPNAFTPNAGGANGGNVDAGNNDVFFPILEGGISKYNMKIYNRWGELLFETNEREIGWDGYYKGNLCKADVYVYKLWVEFSDGKTLNKLGDVTLIR